jgi:hypothetical protein
LVEDGDWEVRHPAIPDFKFARGEEDEVDGWEEEGEEQEYEGEKAESEREEQGGGRGWWSPSLEPIAEEI